jgi:hypothetical protein
VPLQLKRTVPIQLKWIPMEMGKSLPPSGKAEPKFSPGWIQTKMDISLRMK